MKKIISISDKKAIEKFYRKNICLNIYPIGDLDNFFFEHTEWFALINRGSVIYDILEMAYIYCGTDLPVVLAVCDGDNSNMIELLKGIMNILPDKFYTHFSKDLYEVFLDNFTKTDHGRHFKMCLTEKDFKKTNKTENIRRLTPSDIIEISKFYENSYPGNWFDLRMLETGKYFGYYINGELAGAGGIHVYSPEYKVAALGNITTLPEHRGKSICQKLTSALCKDLFLTVDHIGLNVHSENKPAIECYKKLGFSTTGEYFESTFEKR